jgi:hypothetical protein
VKNASDNHYFKASMWFTVLWGILALAFAALASLFDNLIQAINIVGSIFYGVILGIFLVAFFFKKIKSASVFTAAIVSELMVIALFFADKYQFQGFSIAYLWLNLIELILVISLSFLLQNSIFKEKTS